MIVPAGAADSPAPEVRLQKLLAGRVAGEPTNCINRLGRTTSQIINGTIVYRTGNTLYVNVPRSGGDSLRDDDVLVTSTIGSQLCNVDPVTLVDRTARIPHGFLILGNFVPYRKLR